MGLVTGLIQWSKIYPHQLDSKYAKEETGGIWSIDLVVDKDNIRDIEREGLAHLISVKDDGTKIIKFKRNEKSKEKGTANKPPTVVDSQKKPMDSSVLIGNGSTCAISFTTYTGYKSKKYATLQAVQVIKLVKFEGAKGGGAGRDFTVVKDGFTAGLEDDTQDDEPPFEAESKAV